MERQRAGGGVRLALSTPLAPFTAAGAGAGAGVGDGLAVIAMIGALASRLAAFAIRRATEERAVLVLRLVVFAGALVSVAATLAATLAAAALERLRPLATRATGAALALVVVAAVAVVALAARAGFALAPPRVPRVLGAPLDVAVSASTSAAASFARLALL